MKRREVLKLGVVAAGVGAGVPGCALPKLLGELRGDDGAVAFDAMLDDQLGQLAKPGLLHRLVGEMTGTTLSPAATEKIAEHDAKFRHLLGTLLISQGFRELPEETQVQPRVQARMWRHMDRLGSTVFEVSDMLDSLGPTERAHVQTTLRERSDLPMQLGEALDGRAERVGMSRARRRQLRSMMSQAAFRLRNGDPSVLIDECIGKVEKLRASTSTDALSLELSRRLGERDFWRYQHLVDDPGSSNAAATATAPTTVEAPPVTPSGDVARVWREIAAAMQREKHPRMILSVGDVTLDSATVDTQTFDGVRHRESWIVFAGVWTREPLPAPPSSVEPTPSPDHPGTHGLRVGAYMLGIGLLTGLVSAVLVSTSSGGAEGAGIIGLTIAVLLVAIGLLVLLVSALIYAAD